MASSYKSIKKYTIHNHFHDSLKLSRYFIFPIPKLNLKSQGTPRQNLFLLFESRRYYFTKRI